MVQDIMNIPSPLDILFHFKAEHHSDVTVKARTGLTPSLPTPSQTALPWAELSSAGGMGENSGCERR